MRRIFLDMRKLFLMLLCIAVAAVAMAQDLIVKRDGTAIPAKVERVTDSEILYRKASNPNGPQYSIKVSDVLAINYENGEKDTFGSDLTETKSIVTRETASKYSDDKTLLKMYMEQNKYAAKAKKFKTLGVYIGPALMICGAAMIIIPLTCDMYDTVRIPLYTIGSILGAGGVVTTAYGLVKYNYYNRMQKAYNNISSAPLLQHDFNFGDNSSLSLGLDAMRCDLSHTQTVGLGLRYNF